MKLEQKPLSERITGKARGQSDFRVKGQISRIDRDREELIWANKFICNELPLFYLELAGITYSDENYLISRRGDIRNPYNNLFVIEYVTAGKGYIEAKGVRTPVCEGDVYLVDCRHSHRYYADEKDPFEKKWINVRGTFLNAMAPLIFQDNPYVVIHLGQEGGQVMEAIHHKIRAATPADSEMMLAYIMQRILDLFLLIDRERKNEVNTLSQRDRIVRYIEQNICLDLHVTDLVEYFYISSSTLYRMFTSSFGMSPKDFILYKKIEAAKRMIADNESTFNMIAAVLNFYDSHHFFRVFRKYTGMSPTEYKNSVLAVSEDEM